MKPTTAELVASLPAELRDEDRAAAALDDLVASLATTSAPTGRARRLWALTSLEGRLALAHLAWWIRTAFRNDDERQRQRDRLRLDSAVRTLATMSYLRGAAMKLGQVLGNMPNVLPQQYVETLESLHFQAPPMHFSMLRELVRNELGDEPENLFRSFETTAFAAASLGQVHRARTKDGRDVAVKIQYPDIGRTIRADLRNLKMLLAPMRLSGDWENLLEQFAVLCAMLEQETDYLHEAESMKTAREVFREEDGIVVPRVHEALTTQRVLTMDYLAGVHVHEYMRANRSQEERDRRGEQVSVAMFRLFYRRRFVFADPHPGNFVFMADGRLGLLDFGCCHELNDEEWELVIGCDRHARSDGVDWDAAVLDSVPLTERQMHDERRIELLADILRWFWLPLRHKGPFDFSDADFIRRGFDLYAETGRRRYVRAFPMNVWFHRFFLGYRVMLHRLAARVDVRRIYRDESRHHYPASGDDAEQ